jgi:uncharacterized phiE125 gp8 family phage protein
MMLTEVTTVPDAALPIAAFKAHLRLGTGFGEESLQDEVLAGFLRAAIAAIEARTGKVLIERGFEVQVSAWRDASRFVFPVAPVTEVLSFTLIDADDEERAVAPGIYRLVHDNQRPILRPRGSWLPSIPNGGQARVAIMAGMALDWGGLPADLGQAVLLLAAHYYEYRHETALGDGCMPFGVTSLIQRYRSVRVGFGAVQ